MQSKRGELIPVGKIIDGLSGPVQALRETPPPARRGFTLADQVNQLVGASEADPDLGFMGRTMALCSLPRSNPGNRLQYKRSGHERLIFCSLRRQSRRKLSTVPWSVGGSALLRSTPQCIIQVQGD